MKSKRGSYLIIAILLVSLIGVADAGYLTYEHYANPLGGCSLGGCQVVTTSKYSEVFGIPLSLLGVFYYSTIALALGLYWALSIKIIPKLVSYFAVSGFVASIYFVYLQVAVIKAICPFCMISATTSTLLFILGMMYLKTLRIETKEEME